MFNQPDVTYAMMFFLDDCAIRRREDECFQIRHESDPVISTTNYDLSKYYTSIRLN